MSDAEKRALQQKVATLKRKPMKSLLDLILKTPAGDDPAKELIFYKTFAKKYTDKKDGILRNEYAGLKKCAEEVMSESATAADASQNPLLPRLAFVKRLYQSGDYELFDREATKVIEEAEAGFDYHCLKKIYEYYTSMLQLSSWNQPKMTEKMEEVNRLYRAAVCRGFLYEYRRSMILELGAKRMQMTHTATDIPYEDIADDYLSGYEDTMTRFMLCKVLTHAHWGEKRLDKLLECDRLLDSMPSIPTFKQEKFLVLNNLTIGYRLLHQYEAANDCFHKLEPYMSAQPAQSRAIFAYNYAGNLAHLSHYDEAIARLATIPDGDIQALGFQERAGYLRSACLALKGDVHSLLDSLPKNFSEQNKFTEFHYRFLVSVSYYLSGDYETAKREASNLYKTLHQKKMKESAFYREAEIVATHFSQFFTARCDYQLTSDRKKYISKIDALIETADEFCRSSSLLHDMLFYVWFIRELRKEKTSRNSSE